MATSSRNGTAYERLVQQVCAQFRFNNNPLCSGATAGNSHGCDLKLHVDGRIVGIEAKNKSATECGQRSLHIVENHLALPDTALVHMRALGNHVPFGGCVPEFLSATTETQRRALWLAEKADFRDEVLACPSTSIIREYYAAQGASYIQLQGLGLYRTSANDPLQTGAPLLECQARVRIRCKRHGKKGEPPRSIQVSLVMIQKRRIAPSPLSLDDCARVPPSFIRIATKSTSAPNHIATATSKPKTQTT